MEFSPVLYVLRSPQSKEGVFEIWSVQMCKYVGNIYRFIAQKLIKIESANFVHNIRFSGFGEN